MPEWFKEFGETIIWGASLIGAAGIIAVTVRRPIKKVEATVKATHEIAEETQESTYMLMRDRLSWAYDYWTCKRYCPRADKVRLQEMYYQYVGEDEHGRPIRNGLIETFVEDLMALPEYPPSRLKKA